MTSFCPSGSLQAMSDIRGTNHLNAGEYRGILMAVVDWLCLPSSCSSGANLNTYFLLSRCSYLTGIANPIQLSLLLAAHLAEGCWKNGLSARRHKDFSVLVNGLRYLSALWAVREFSICWVLVFTETSLCFI